ncbi:hypothetical protein ACF0H5_013605 [Mactra antiquata]
MSSFEHHATVDKGLKMKIKRKNVEKTEKSKKEQSKSDLLKSDCKLGESSQSVNGMLADKSGKLSLFSDKEKSPKSKSTLTKKDKAKSLAKSDTTTSGASSGSSLNGVEGLFTQSSTMEPKLGETASGRPDPYEFNAKVEDGISMPMKKIKLDKEKSVENNSSAPTMTGSLSSMSSHDASTDTHDVAVVTDPDCLGPCEPGTQVTLEGIVWHESENGVLVVNVTWRGKTYVGTLLDATRHDWAPPRFNCDSPTEFESRTPGKGRGKRRGAANTPINDTRTLRKGRRGSSAQTFTAPPSPAKSDASNSGVKRKGRPQDIDLSSAEQRCSKRSRSGSQAPTPNAETPPTDAQGYLECPEPNCSKKYKNANGLKYHQSHAHSGCVTTPTVEDCKEEMDTEDIPLSVVKNSVRKEKEAAKSKDSKKESNKDSEKSKNEKGDNSASKKVDKEESNSEVKDTNGKSENKCDNSNNARKKENNANKNTLVQGNGKTSGSQNNKNSSNINSSSSSSSLSSLSSSHSTISSQVNSDTTVQTITSQTSSVSASSVATSSSAALTSVVQSSTQGEKSDSKLVDIKPKITSDTRVTKPNRPIVPAPSHTVLSNVQVTHSNMSPVMSHTQMSPQLKPIQPKPTIMGEPQNINPALADLNKDRKKAQKKKVKDGAQPGNNANIKSDQPTIKIERTGVIKTNPLPNHRQIDQQKRDGGATKDTSRPGSNDTPRSHSLTPHMHKGVDLAHSRGSHNPNLLKVGSPLQVNTPDNHKGGAVNDDVQSPAYSDISDANESASPAAPSDVSPQKQKEDNNSNKKEEKSETTPPQSTDSQMMPHYGMYSYYAQSPYRMNDMSPGQKSTGSTGSTPSQHSQPNQESGKNSQSSNDKKSSEEVVIKTEKKDNEKDGNRPKGLPPPTQPMPGQLPSNMSPQQMHDYQVMWHQMYVQSLPQHLQYQHMASNGGWYGPQMDSNYLRMMEEQQRRSGQPGEPGRNERDGQGPERDPSRGPEMKGQLTPGPHSGKRDEGGPQKAMVSPMQGQPGERRDGMKSSDEKLKDQSLREKQNETHQILKENHDLKSEMDKNRQEHYRKAEERRRYQMYQEQKMFEERKKQELAARKGESRPENLTTKAPGTKPIIEHTSRNMSSGPRSSMEIPRDHKRESSAGSVDPKHKDNRESHSRDLSANKYSDSGKSLDEKSRTPIPEKHRSETPTRTPETPKQRPGGSSSKSGSPLTSISSSVAGSPSYSPFVNHLSYMQNPHYIGLDPSHPLYRSHNVNPALISAGFPPGSTGYIHPSQMGYRPPGSGDDVEKEKLSAQKSAGQPLPSSDTDLKKAEGGSGHGGPYYNSNVHKIHELSEKGRPKSRNSSPGPVKPTDTSTSTYDKHREFTNSPPTQRHVHTHHHTHVLQPGPGLQPGQTLQPPGFSPVYDPYINSAMFVSQAQSPHQFPPK